MAATNWASQANGGTATASSSLGTYPPTWANDGDKLGLNIASGGAWASGAATVPQWLQIDFSASRSIDQIDVYLVQDAPFSPSTPTLYMTGTTYVLSNYDIQYWNGSSWVTIESVVSDHHIWHEVTFAAVSTTKIRINITGAAPDGFSRIVEVEAWGGGTPDERITRLAVRAVEHVANPPERISRVAVRAVETVANPPIRISREVVRAVELTSNPPIRVSRAVVRVVTTSGPTPSLKVSRVVVRTVTFLASTGGDLHPLDMG